MENKEKYCQCSFTMIMRGKEDRPFCSECKKLVKEELNNDALKSCSICGEETKTVFNINFKAIPICESCADSIFLQQAQWYSKSNLKTLDKS